MDSNEKVLNEKNELLLIIEELKKENDALKQSVYHLSYLLSLRNLNNSNIIDQKSNFSNNNNNNNNNETSNLDQYHRLSKDAITELANIGIDVPTLFSRSRGHTLEDDDNRFLSLECEFTAHKGAIYCAAYSKCGSYFATGGLDSYIRIYNNIYPYKEINSLEGHTNLISSIAWDQLIDINSSNNKSKILFSTSFDKSLKIWDIEKSVCLFTVKLKGFGSAVKIITSSSSNMNGCGVVISNSNEILIVDAREMKVVQSIDLAVVPTSICCIDSYFLVGDDRGIISTYDNRNILISTQLLVEGSNPPYRITDVISINGNLDELNTNSPNQQQYLIFAQCSDNCIRVLNLSFEKNELLTNEIISKLILVYAFRGHIFGELIKMDIFRGQKHRNLPSWSRKTSYYQDSKEEIINDDKKDSKEDIGTATMTWSNSLMVSTGSVCGQVHVFDLSNPQLSEPKCFQKLNSVGKGQVYGCCYNPLSTTTLPELLTYAADGSIRIYSAKKSGKY